MKDTINGYELREAIRRATVARAAIAASFEDSVFQFKDDQGSKLTPQQIIDQFSAADQRLAVLEAAQQVYNILTLVRVQAISNVQVLPLAVLVKMVGGLGRVEKMWRTAITDSKERFYVRQERRRDKDAEYADRMVTVEDAIRASKDTARRASQVRNAIARGNTEEISVEKIANQINISAEELTALLRDD